MQRIRFGRDEHGRVTALVASELSPIDQFLEDIGDNPDTWREIIDHLNQPDPEWGTGGNSCWISINPNSVVVENQFNDQSVTLSHGEFLEIAQAFTQEVATARNEDRRRGE